MIINELFEIINNIQKNYYNNSLNYNYTIIKNDNKSNFKTKNINNLKINTMPKTKSIKKKIQPTRKIFK